MFVVTENLIRRSRVQHWQGSATARNRKKGREQIRRASLAASAFKALSQGHRNSLRQRLSGQLRELVGHLFRFRVLDVQSHLSTIRPGWWKSYCDRSSIGRTYLNGFSANVQDILENFKFRNQLTTLSRADAIGALINKFLDPGIDLSPAGIDNHSMGSVFEELVRKFNEENNEEAGEHWTPRDAVRLMANLVFLPIQADIKSGTYLLYDCACGTGGMLTVAEETLTATEHRGPSR